MGTMRINHNISAINTQRQLQKTTATQEKTLERLSSGLRVNRGADGPAALVISERMRSQISGLHQAIDNSESGISMVQTAEGALNETSRLLIKARELAIHAANEGVNDDVMLQADQDELENVMATVDRIATNTQFGTKNLLDGSRGANGVANGNGLEFVSAATTTRSSGVEGYAVQIDQVATRSDLKGTAALTQEIINAKERITISEGGRSLNFETKAGESIESTFNALDAKIRESGLNIELVRNPNNIIELKHKEFGSGHVLLASSSTAGLISEVSNVAVKAMEGLDVAGRLNGEEAVGKGQVLTGKESTRNVEGLAVRYTGAPPTQPGQIMGAVSVFQNSLVYQIGANHGQTTSVSLKNMSSSSIGQGVRNDSGFNSASEVNLMNAAKAQDAIMVIDRAIEEIASTRANLGAFQKNNLESNLNSLRNSHENLTNAESIIRDADMAAEMAELTSNQILVQSGTAMLAQANQLPQSVMSLLNGR